MTTATTSLGVSTPHIFFLDQDALVGIINEVVENKATSESIAAKILEQGKAILKRQPLNGERVTHALPRIVRCDDVFTSFYKGYKKTCDDALKILEAIKQKQKNVTKLDPNTIQLAKKNFAEMKKFIADCQMHQHQSNEDLPSLVEEMKFYESRLKELKPQQRSQKHITKVCELLDSSVAANEYISICSEVGNEFRSNVKEYNSLINSWNQILDQFSELEVFHNIFETIIHFAIPCCEYVNAPRNVDLGEYANFKRNLINHLKEQRAWCEQDSYPRFVYDSETMGQLKEWFIFVTQSDQASEEIKKHLEEIKDSQDLISSLFKKPSILQPLIDSSIHPNPLEIVKLRNILHAIQNFHNFMKYWKGELSEILEGLNRQFVELDSYIESKESIDLKQDLTIFNASMRKFRYEGSLKTHHNKLASWQESYHELEQRVKKIKGPVLPKDLIAINDSYKKSVLDIGRAECCVESTKHLKDSDELAYPHYISETAYLGGIAINATANAASATTTALKTGAYNAAQNVLQMIGLQ